MRFSLVEDLDLHPDIGVVPAMAEPDFAVFAADVRDHGVLNPLELLPGSRIVIDGRTRLRAARLVKIAAVPTIFADLGVFSPRTYMIRSALLRRQLSTGQKLKLASELYSELAALAKVRQRLSKGRGLKGRECVPDLLDSPENSAITPGRTRDQVGEIVGINPRYVDGIQLLRVSSPELAERVYRNELTLPAALRELRETLPDPVEQAQTTERGERETRGEYAVRVFTRMFTEMRNEWITAADLTLVRDLFHDLAERLT